MADDLVNRVLATTIPLFFRDFQDSVAKMAVEYWWALKHGLFTYGQGGSQIQWRSRQRRGSPIGFSGGTESKTFAVRNDYEIATLPWRGIADGLVVTKQEIWQCKGKEEIIKLVPTLLADLKDDLLDRFGTDFYGDGTSLGSKTFHGLAASISQNLNLTYAGLSQTTFANWQNQAIDGTGFAGDPMSKLLSLQIACAKGQRGGRTRNQIDIYLASGTDYQVVVNSEIAKQRFTENIEMAESGFRNIECWGVPLAWSEYAGVFATNTIMGLNSNLFEFLCSTDQLFEAETEWTPGFPKLFLGIGLSHFNLLNKNPRGSGLIYNTAS